ncbi:MAG: DUF4351 domain-containing protein [Gammaproteobacteria bacterium]|nr:DUF4351 domain-containing protein [Gammaproteobacteria bacterium]
MEGRKVGIQEGQQKGRLEGETLILQRLLFRRFGPLPQEVLARIASASEAEITSWVDRVLDANCIEEVFHLSQPSP